MPGLRSRIGKWLSLDRKPKAGNRKLEDLLLPGIAARKGTLAGGVACLAMALLCLLALPRWATSLIHEVLPSRDTGLLFRSMATGLGLVALMAAFSFGRDYLFTSVVHRLVAGLRLRLFERLLEMPWLSVSRRAAGEIISRYSNDMVVLQQSLDGFAAVFIPNAALLAGLVCAMCWYSWRLTLVVAAMAAPVAGAIHFFGKRIYAAVHRTQSRAANLTALVGESIDGAKEIRSFTREELVMERFKKLNREALETNLREGKMFAINPPVVSVLMGAMVCALVVAGTVTYRHGLLTQQDLIAFMACVVLMTGRMGEVARTVGYLGRITAILGRVDEILSQPGAETAAAGSLPGLPPAKGRISFERVSFAYGKDGPAIEGIDLEIAARETVAFVGRSGAGKSTLLNLLPRFIEPDSGVIRIDGNDIAGCCIESLRRQIAIVTQDPFLFETTLRENLLFGKPDATPLEIQTAARMAHVEEFVARLPLGYETPVGPRGSTLSAGQRQRVSIARALLKDAPILLLDEPTSALDPESEELVRDALDQIRRDRTTLIVAHRLSTIRNADRVVLMNRGRIARIFTRDEWLARRESIGEEPVESLA